MRLARRNSFSDIARSSSSARCRDRVRALAGIFARKVLNLFVIPSILTACKWAADHSACC